MKKAVDILRRLRAEAPDSGTDYNRGYHEALYELEDRILDAMWEEGEDDQDA